ncbi:beta-ketoacyl-[acyl-carrier-protein] synthase family protein [Candidatus Woesearchaeota archaeon]|nr:beta-ketoacyl-[acyl-carrier-protein] synthase family protein [Candidatus Woesearchaeota archaeon]
MTRKIVVTGIGTISSTGKDKEELWTNLLNGRSGIKTITQFDVSKFQTRIGGEINPTIVELFLQRERRPLDLCAGYALYAADQAIKDSGIELYKVDAERVGVVIGSSKGPFATICSAIRKISVEIPIDSYHLSDCCHGSLSTTIAIKYGLKGVNHLISSTSASSAHAIGLAFEKIKYGKQDVVVCGGAENPLLPEIFAMYEATRIMSRKNENPERACKPFDKERDGIVLGDGAGILILEELEHAKRRGANIYCELAGYGATSDAYHPASIPPDANGMIRAMKLALQEGEINPEEVGYINPHGTATRLNDRMETLAIKRLFGQRSSQIPVSSTKSITGHLSGASASLEAVICSLVISRGIIPPTINYQNPDPDCDLDYVPNQAREQKVDVILKNSLGFGGTNASLVFNRYY